MLTEKWGIFSDAQAITGSGASDSSSTLDTEVAGSNIGGGTPIWLVVRVNTTFTCATSGTMYATLQNCATSNGTYLDMLRSATYTVGSLVKGLDVLTVPLTVDNLRYLKVLYTNAVGSGMTAGNFDAFLSLNAPRN